LGEGVQGSLRRGIPHAGQQQVAALAFGSCVRPRCRPRCGCRRP
jgi:hypothetical protein